MPLWTSAELLDLAALYDDWTGAALAPTVDVSLSAWAEANIVLPPTAPIPGPLDLSITPYVRGLLDLCVDPEVSEITFIKSTQVGGSLILICLIGYAAHHRQVPVVIVQPKEEAAKSFNRSRLRPVFEASPNLAALLPPKHGSGGFQLQLKNGVALRFASAGSATDLAEASVPIIVFDEFDKYEYRVGREADPIALGQERLRWWQDTLMFKPTTPTIEQAFGWRELGRAKCQIRHYVPCPRCVTWQVLYFAGEAEENVPGPAGRVCWPVDKNGHALHFPEEIKKRKLAWYECGACTAKWSEKDKEAAVAQGQWRETNPGAPRDHVGAHIWALYSPRLGISDVAAKYLSCKDKPELLQNFVNSWLARPFKEQGERPSFEIVTQKRTGYECGRVPEGVRFLTAAVDIHKALQYWSLWGWGAGMTGWLVDAGRVDFALKSDEVGWDEVFNAVIRERLAWEGAEAMSVIEGVGGIVFMDAGWDRTENEDENTEEGATIEICDRFNARLGRPIFQPAKGSSHPMFPHLDWRGKSYDRDRRGRPMKWRLQLHRFDPFFFKTEFHRRLALTSEVGGLRLPRDVPEIVMRQFLGEGKITLPDGRIIWKRTGQNHFFDTGVMSLAGAWKSRMMLEASAAGGGESVSLSQMQKGN